MRWLRIAIGFTVTLLTLLCMTGTLHFFAIVGAMLNLIVAERTGHAHVGFVTENVCSSSELGFHRRHHQLRRTWAKADDSQTSARTTDLRNIQRLFGHGDGYIVGCCDDSSVRDCIASQLTDVIRWRNKAQRHRQLERSFTQGRTGHLNVRRHQTGQRLNRHPGLLQRTAKGARQDSHV